MSSDPYLSFVMVSRNDDYGGNLLHRMKISLNSILELSDRHELKSEIVLIEWNPPQDKDRLVNELDLNEHEFCDIRIITVPAGIHNEISKTESPPILEYVGKNTGIRRANGEYILSTNPDIIFNEHLFKYFSQSPLSEENYYRIDRYDLGCMIPDDDGIDWMLNFARENVESIFTEKGKISTNNIFNRLIDRLLLYKNYPGLIVANTKRALPLNSKPKSIYNLHFSASGDFILLHKDSWNEIRGHPEMGLDFHIDSYTVAKAASFGFEEIIIRNNCRIYHQPHTTAHDERPKADWNELVNRSKKWLRTEQPEIFNDTTWGLKNYDLPTITTISGQ